MLQNMIGAGGGALGADVRPAVAGIDDAQTRQRKLPIARAAMPMFSPSCGSTRMTTGPARLTPDLVLSVPEPDISLHFLIQLLKSLNQVPTYLIQRLKRGSTFDACRAAFSQAI